MKNILLSIFVVAQLGVLLAQNLVRSKENAHEGGITALNISEDGSLILTGGPDTKSYLWSTKSGEKLKGALKHVDKVTAVALSANNKLYMTGSSDFKIRVLDIDAGQPTRILTEHTAEVTSVVFNPINNFIAAASKDKLIKIWDNTKSKASLFTLAGHENEVTDIEFSPDGKFLLSASLDNTIKIWEAATGTMVKSLDAGSSGVNALAISSDQSIFATAGNNEVVTIWNFEKQTKISEIKG